MSELSDKINKLPFWARDYIHNLETRADPSGEVQELVCRREQVKQLEELVLQLTADLGRLQYRVDELTCYVSSGRRPSYIIN